MVINNNSDAKHRAQASLKGYWMRQSYINAIALSITDIIVKVKNAAQYQNVIIGSKL